MQAGPGEDLGLPAGAPPPAAPRPHLGILFASLGWASRWWHPLGPPLPLALARRVDGGAELLCRLSWHCWLMLHGLRARFADFAASLPPAPLSRLSSPPPPCICVGIYVGMLCVHGYANILCSCVYGRSPRLSNPAFWATANRRVCPCVRRERKRERERERVCVLCVCECVCVMCRLCVLSHAV